MTYCTVFCMVRGAKTKQAANRLIGRLRGSSIGVVNDDL